MTTIEEVYAELNYPTKRKLALALNTRHIPFTGAQLEDLTRKSGVRQIFGPPPKYDGKITSAHMNERWQADLVDMTSKPGANGEDHILFVMDIFTRRVWVRAIVGSSASVVADAFESILEETGTHPTQLNTDGGGEFQSSFAKMLERRSINHRRKETPDARNDLGTLDAAIGKIKLDLEKEKTHKKEPDFVKVLSKVVRGYNAQPHSHLDNEAPKDIESNLGLRLELRQQAVREDMHNNDLNTKKQNRLTSEGAFRTLVPGSQFKRRDQPRYSNEVYRVASVIGNKVIDEHGNAHLSKLVLPVPSMSEATTTMRYTRGGSARVDANKRQILQPFADSLANELMGSPNQTVIRISRFLKRLEGFNAKMKEARLPLNVKRFLELFPDVFQRVGNRVSVQLRGSLIYPTASRLRRIHPSRLQPESPVVMADEAGRVFIR